MGFIASHVHATITEGVYDLDGDRGCQHDYTEGVVKCVLESACLSWKRVERQQKYNSLYCHWKKGNYVYENGSVKTHDATVNEKAKLSPMTMKTKQKLW